MKLCKKNAAAFLCLLLLTSCATSLSKSSAVAKIKAGAPLGVAEAAAIPVILLEIDNEPSSYWSTNAVSGLCGTTDFENWTPLAEAPYAAIVQIPVPMTECWQFFKAYNRLK